MNVQVVEKGKRRSPLGPLFGLILLLGVTGVAYLAAPAIAAWLQNTTFTLGATGWQVLPITFPAEWPEIVVRLVLTGIVTLVAFTVMMPVLFLFMRPARDELDVDTAKLRAEKQRQKKRR